MKREFLILYRKSLGLTIKQTADRLECTSTHYNNIELGKADCSDELKAKFQSVFGVPDEDMWKMFKRGNFDYAKSSFINWKN